MTILDTLERLERAATPGPWGVDPRCIDSEADAALIAAARNALPGLLAAIKAGRECADDLESVLRAHYEGTLDYPSQRSRFERDMAPVVALRAALAALEDRP